MSTVKEEKKALRDVLGKRCEEASQDVVAASLALKDRFLEASDFVDRGLTGNLLVSAYSGYGAEIDPLPLMKELLSKGHKFCLPCIQQKGEPLVFRAYDLGDPVRLGVWGIPEPLVSAPVVHPDVMFIPMLGFDRRGNRLGRGGGFYDRTLNEARHNRKVYAIGLAYACQEVPVIPCGPYEARLDAIVTDKEYIVLAKAN
ncbi:MAG: 5-formyltetrahydrofolate cyclo-ligase [Proteobacteria bacterium]|jgi:5-formyltetrahydrofolate cyclo-ligase|nr:5-formyltetrahydrofolate cyclo-ligase [Alphaproteobacteria bacterium]NCC04106.1 5-formyltetrahydrofolate cyclo-ligase [Pseudomonadota bacterium]